MKSRFSQNPNLSTQIPAMICPSCGHQNAADATECAACATPLPSNIQTGGTQPPTGEAPVYAPHLPKNTRLQDGNYAVGEVLGQGGFGITYKGGDLSLRRYVAIKEFFPQGCARQGANVAPAGNLSDADYARVKAKFVEEARTLARFSDPGIVRVFGVFEENNTAYMAMEFLEGATLSARIAQQGTLDEAEAVGIAEKISNALKVVHESGIIHRDLKPDNICLTNDGRVVLIDFGTARAFASGKTVKQTTMLTPGYAPLEQYGQQARFGAYTDIYALAATLYHAVTGQVPPQATDRASGVELRAPRELNPQLSPAFSKALVWAMNIKAADRPQNVGAFVAALKTKLQPNLAPLDGLAAPPAPTPPVALAPSGWGSAAAPVGAPADEKWFHALGGQQVGPMSRTALGNLVKNGVLRADTLIWKEGTPDWIKVENSDWASQARPEARIPRADNTDYLQTNYTGFDRFMMGVPAWIWRTMWTIIIVVVVGRIGVAVVRYQNGGRDFGPELASEVLSVDKGPLRSANLEFGERELDSETMVRIYDGYQGRVRYKDGDSGDLTLRVTGRDWLYRPDKFSYAYEPTDFGAEIAGEIKSDLRQKLGTKIDSVYLRRQSRNRYSGGFSLDSPDFGAARGGGSIEVKVLSFDDSDGSPDRWVYSVE